ncbi:hypothetical protein, conserved [Eimeria tenella]|uniref:Phosphatidylethanolamine-binding protein n=1 Tax=Eimeria tenella TaxID=5802 RepID=U6KKD2_EIMTE|nr:hypothetical protein, conserved [Eimeria tenella]CDJ37286.1 hypothetical protein, conserved [Eimeria tenella]|eukprot:XP_013228124.1 hypothetical protein, conserved [Eimeria tenella]
MSFSKDIKRFQLARVLALCLAVACVRSPSAGAVQLSRATHLKDLRHHKVPYGSFDYARLQPSAAPLSGIETAETETEALKEEGAKFAWPISQYGGEADGHLDMIFLEAHNKASSLLEHSSHRGSVSCSVSFSAGYRTSPIVEVTGETSATDTATAVFVDETARFWFHGLRTGVSIPSTFRFEPKGAGGDYADIHPPPGTGAHHYTVVLYKGQLEPGPLLSALFGTPWNNRRRAVGSLRAIEGDLRKQNAGKQVEELCRCTVQVSYEDFPQEE